MSFWVSYCGNMTLLSIFQDGGRSHSILLPVSYLLMSLPSAGHNLSTNQILSDISIDGWDTTTSIFEKQTSTILEFYFIILHQHTEYRPNRSTRCGNMTSYPFLNMAATTTKYYFRFRIYRCHCIQKVKVYQINQISSRYLSWRLRYNYFRFWNTNVRHIGILLLVSISTILL